MAAEPTEDESGAPDKPKDPPNGAADAADDDDETSEDEAETTAGTQHADNRHDDDDEEDEDDEEPKLKYTKLTGSLGPVYRSGDATSAFMVAGDKMMIGTHNGNIHVLQTPTFQSLRFYHAHSASITSVSISPFPPPLPSTRAEAVQKVVAESSATGASSPRPGSIKSGATSSPRRPQQPPVPVTPSNSIHIATSSIDGHVCVFSLVDPKDVTLRNFARPVNSVALSPDFKNDRTYLSGGLAGNLIMTVGGKAGVSANANTNSAAAAASGWLGAIGLGSNTGKDTILHSGEGSISTVKWSLSGKYVAWVNEKGIKIARSNMELESADAESAWKRIGHIDAPSHGQWEEMAGVWKARAEWMDDEKLESDEDAVIHHGNHHNAASKDTIATHKTKHSTRRKKIEKLVVGWGDAAWVIHVHPGGAGIGKDAGERSVGKPDVVHKLIFEDCIISGLSLYTPSLLLILAYRTRDDQNRPITAAAPDPSSTPTRRGIHHRQNGLSPELRIIETTTQAEIDVDTLTMSRFESLTAADYHLSTLYVPPPQVAGPAQKGALEAISGGLWDAGVSATKIFSSGASIISFPTSGEEKTKSPAGSAIGKAPITPKKLQDPYPTATTAGLKIFIQSPYDCVLAVKRDLSDHLSWLLERERYQHAWELIDEHPEVISASPADSLTLPEPQVMSPSGNKIQQSLADFFADDETASQTTNTTSAAMRAHNSSVEKEKRRVGDLWIQQLVSAKDWTTAGQVAGKVLGTSSRWEHWVWAFAQADRFDEITPYIPSMQLKPPLPSLVYEVVLGHYIIHDRLRLRELLDAWDPDLFDIGSVTSAIEAKLRAGDINENSVEGGEKGRDWRILLDALAKLYIADNRPREALRCYIRLQNADAAMALIRDYHLIAAIADDIPGLLMLRVSKRQLDNAPLEVLDQASTEAVGLLVDEATKGIVRPDTVVEQLQKKGLSYQPFLFFYLRSLWQGSTSDDEEDRLDRTRTLRKRDRVADEGKPLVEDYADLAVDLFAEYDRELLMEFLKGSQSYDYTHASQVCEQRNYIPELVYLLSKTGQTKRALRLIIEKLGDVSAAISFAKEQDDKELWDDLLEFSMDKPRFIRGLLEEVGTAIEPLRLVKRIPEGLEIEGLRDGLGRMLREYEIQSSISEGVARVLRGEMITGLDALREGRRRGVKFQTVHRDEDVELHVKKVEEPGLSEKKDMVVPETTVVDVDAKEDAKQGKKSFKPGYCVGCGEAFGEEETQTLIGFACSHVYHLACLLDLKKEANPAVTANTRAAEDLEDQLAAEAAKDPNYGLGASREELKRLTTKKVEHARLIREAVGEGCPVCVVPEV